MSRYLRIAAVASLLLLPAAMSADDRDRYRDRDNRYGWGNYPRYSESDKEWRKAQKEREKDRREAWKEAQKDRREAWREAEKDRREARREWEKDRREARKELRDRYR
jgi:hypothetical protein